MRITISHKRSKEEVKQTVDRSFDQVFQGMEGIPVQVLVDHKSWQGDVMTFAVTAKLAFMSTPITGTVEVTDHEVTVEADLGVLGKFVSEKAAQDVIGQRIKGLLK